ncbi:MAG: hypothetical protein C5B58_09115 [Acidobacteria bacterium]|nr:MAG: hypothetical protein C5B58_09115 [Acidobacteriota bacterium]
MAFAKPSVKLGLPRMDQGTDRHTDTNEFLSAGVLIAYQKRPGYPTQQMKNAVNAAAIQARNIVRIANDALAKVVLLRRPESQLFQDTMAKHFKLTAGDPAGGLLKDNIVDKPFSPKAMFVLDRRWVLERIRQNLLSLSFHLNTGVYLIDQDTANRDVFSGAKQVVGHAPYSGWVGYVHPRGPQKGIRSALCGFRNGEIHIDFQSFLGFSLNTNACIIIHEAAHKFVGILGDTYGDNPNYPPDLQKKGGSLDNADSLAWTAISLATGAVRMQMHNSSDFATCPGGPL